jgi:hypothetical protein
MSLRDSTNGTVQAEGNITVIQLQNPSSNSSPAFFQQPVFIVGLAGGIVIFLFLALMGALFWKKPAVKNTDFKKGKDFSWRNSKAVDDVENPEAEIQGTVCFQFHSGDADNRNSELMTECGKMNESADLIAYYADDSSSYPVEFLTEVQRSRRL